MKEKVGALVNISRCLKRDRKYAMAKEMAWRALEYALFFGDHSREFEIYDLVGRISFLEGRMGDAEFYHKLAMNADPESSKGLVDVARTNCRNFLKSRTIVRPNITLEVLFHMDFSFSFLSLVSKEFQSDQMRLLSDGDSKPIPQKTLSEMQDAVSLKIRYTEPLFILSNDVSFNSVVSQILKDPEFERRPVESNVEEEKKKTLANQPEKIQKERELEAKSLRASNAKHALIKTQSGSLFKGDLPRKPPIFKDFPHKVSLDAEVERVMARNLKLTSNEVYDRIISRFPKLKIGEDQGKRVYVSHLSPNRSIFEFDQHFNPNFSSIKQFFSDLSLLFARDD